MLANTYYRFACATIGFLSSRMDDMLAARTSGKLCPNGMHHSPTDVDDAKTKGLEVATFALG